MFGAGFFQRVRHVILPMLKPSIQVALLLRLIFAFEVFAVVIAITGSGRDGARGRGVQLAGDQRERARRGRVLDVILGLSLVAAAVVLVVAADAAGSRGCADGACRASGSAGCSRTSRRSPSRRSSSRRST